MTDSRWNVAPSLVVRVTDDGPVVPGLVGRPGAATAALPIGDGVYLSPDPDYPGIQMWVPLDRDRLEVLRLLAERAPVLRGELVEEYCRGREDATPLADDLEQFLAQLDAAGLIAPEGAVDWAPRTTWRADTIPWEREPAVDPGTELEPGTERHLRRSDSTALVVTPEGFARRDADGTTRDVLSSTDVMVMAAVHPSRDLAAIHRALGSELGVDLSPRELDAILRSLARRGLITAIDDAATERLRAALIQRAQSYQQTEAAIRGLVDRERDHAERAGVTRPIVLALDPDANPLLSLGTVLAYAQAHDGGRLLASYAFAPIVHTDPSRLDQIVGALQGWPTVVLFSDYTWTRAANLAMTAALKARMPDALTIHGGPEMPKYDGDAERFFAENPGIDCGVRGEGEATFAALLVALEASIPAWTHQRQAIDLSPLAEVAGLTYRTADGGVRTTGDRDRVEDLDSIPSPYLTGLFDDIARRHASSVIIESNRGCPYGCTFCDWGSATLSRIRKFDLDRVKAEMEWAVQHGITSIGLTDANFGIFDRDIDIAAWAVELKERYGRPTELQVTYSKNRVKNLTRIVRILAEAGILTQAAVSVQTMDEQVLKIVRRKNLDVTQHVPLVQEIEDLQLPMYSDLMLGLPGATVETVRRDLQFCIDREIHYRPNPTQLLVNSPMNDEQYRTDHGIVAVPGEYLMESRTYTREDMRVMADLAEYLLMADRRGTFRELATYTRHEVGIAEADFYERLIAAGRDARRWPFLGYVNTLVTREFVPPGSWTRVVEEIGDVMVDLGVPDDDALATVLAVQRALIPTMGRSFPESLALPHDYLAWHADVRRARRVTSEGEWGAEVGHLREQPPGTFVVRGDPEGCRRVIGTKPRGSWEEIVWELDTPVARSIQRPEPTSPPVGIR